MAKCFTRPTPALEAMARATELSERAVKLTSSLQRPSKKARAFLKSNASPTVWVSATNSASPELVVTTFWARTKEKARAPFTYSWPELKLFRVARSLAKLESEIASTRWWAFLL